MQQTLETWDQKMHRLVVEYHVLKARREVALVEGKGKLTLKWKKLTDQIRSQRYAIDRHVEALGDE